MSFLTALIISIGALVLVGFIVFWVVLELQFKCRLRVKETINGRKIIRDYRAKEYTDKEGVHYWRLSGEKIKVRRLIPIPPDECIEITHKGRKIAECYRTQTGDIIWSKDRFNVQEIPEDLYDDLPEQIIETQSEAERKELTKRWKESKLKQWKKDNNVVMAVEPVTTKQRMVYLNNIKKAESRKGLDWKMQLVPIASLGFFAIIIFGIFIFWEDITKPALQANTQFIEAQKLHKETMEILRDIKTGQQTISQGINDIKEAPPNVPD